MAENKPGSLQGILYIVSTPIGNLADISLRAIEILKTVDLVAAEDTRHTGKLLSHYGVPAKLISCHEHNEEKRAWEITKKLLEGRSVALVSNAGTPGVSDPGYRVLEAAALEGIKLVPIPGPSATLAALAASGLPSDSFFFAGFPPRKPSKRRGRLKQLACLPATLIFYESPRRIEELVQDILEIMGDRRVVLAREITKRYEEFIRKTASGLLSELRNRGGVKGEVTLLVSGREDGGQNFTDEMESEIMEAVSEGKEGTSSLSRRLAERYGVSRNRIYDMILKLRSGSSGGGTDKDRGFE